MLGHAGVARRDRSQPRPLIGHVVHRRHVHPGHRRQVAQDALARARRSATRLPLADDLGDLADHLFAVADDEDVDEVGQGLGVERAVTAGHDQRVLRAPVGGPYGHTRQIDAVEDVGVDELGGDVEGE